MKTVFNISIADSKGGWEEICLGTKKNNFLIQCGLAVDVANC